jgi:hypothetical protein
MVRMVGVGIVVDRLLARRVLLARRGLIMPKIYMAAESHVKCIFISFSLYLLSGVFTVAIFMSFSASFSASFSFDYHQND